MSAYLIALIISCCIFTIMAVSLDIAMGETGIFSAAHAVFMAIGAYTAMLTITHWSDSVLVGLLTGVIVAGVVGLLFALVAARSVEITFVVSSLALGITFTQVLATWTDVTGGQAGLSTFDPPTVFGLVLDTPYALLCLTLALTAAVLLVRVVIARSGLGLRMRLAREDEAAASAFGARVAVTKVIAVVLSAALGSVGGVLYTYYYQYISPDSFSINLSLLIAVMVIIGGIGRVVGPALGAILITLLPDWLQGLDIPPQYMGSTTQIIYGLALVAVMMVEPGGLQSLLTKAGRRAAAPLRSALAGRGHLHDSAHSVGKASS